MRPPTMQAAIKKQVLIISGALNFITDIMSKCNTIAPDNINVYKIAVPIICNIIFIVSN